MNQSKIGRPPIDGVPRDRWIHMRVTEEQARKLKAMGGYKVLRDLIDQQASDHRPARLEDVWRNA